MGWQFISVDLTSLGVSNRVLGDFIYLMNAVGFFPDMELPISKWTLIILQIWKLRSEHWEALRHLKFSGKSTVGCTCSASPCPGMLPLSLSIP